MRLNQITVFVTDIERAIAFYELLGLRLIVKSAHYARFEAPRGEATFSIHIASGEIARTNAPQIYFEVSDVDFEVRRLKLAGVAIEHEPKAQSWLWYEAWLRDPDGNAICLFHAGEARRYPPWRVDTAPGAANLHLVIRDGAAWSVVKNDGGEESWRTLQVRYGDYKTSLGPFDIYALLVVLEDQWPDLFLAHDEAIRAFAASEATALDLWTPA